MLSKILREKNGDVGLHRALSPGSITSRHLERRRESEKRQERGKGPGPSDRTKTTTRAWVNSPPRPISARPDAYIHRGQPTGKTELPENSNFTRSRQRWGTSDVRSILMFPTRLRRSRTLRATTEQCGGLPSQRPRRPTGAERACKLRGKFHLEIFRP